MAGIKISNLPPVVAPALTDVFPIDQGAVTYKETAQQLLSLFESNIIITPSNFSGTLPVANGGSGNTTFTSYSVITAGTTATGAFQNVVGVGTSGQQLTSNGAGALPSWQAGGGNPLTTKGDLFTFTTVDARLAVGVTNGQVLQVNSATATGLAWSTPAYPSASGTAGFILRSDGTNNVYSQTTYPDIVNASSFLYANGANNIAGLATANNGLPVTGNTGIPVMLAGPAATGRVLTSNAAAAPSWSTSTFPSVGGSAGNILISDGTNYIGSTSLWPNTVGAVGKILRSDGTTNAYTTATFPTTAGSSGNVLTSDGTNWSSSSPAGSATSVIVDDTTTNATMYPTWVTANTGSLPLKVSSTKISFNPSTALLTLSGAIQSVTQINDANGNEVLKFGSVASAVNEITLTNAATTGNPTFAATGSDTNIGITSQTKGTGGFNFLGTSTHAAALNLYENTGNGTNLIGIYAPEALAASYSLTLPLADALVANYTMVSNAAGGLSFSGTPNVGAATATSINFGQDSLNYYDEGTWTPIDSSGAALSFTLATGSYVRIGAMVVAMCAVTYPVTVNGAAATIGGLPFTSSSSQSSRGGQVVFSQAATLTGSIVGVSATTFTLQTAGGGSFLNSAASGLAFYFNITYLLF